MSRYAALFSRLAARREGAFIPFCVIGDPDPEASLENMRALARGGADALELAIPFSDPIADGPTIAAAAVRALRAGTRPADAFALLARLRREHAELPLGLLVYANLVEVRGRARFYRECADAGVDSVLVADVPTVEAPPFVAEALAAGVEPVLIAAPNSPEPELARIAALSRGYTYVVSRRGVTGAETSAVTAHHALLATLARLGAPPAVLGFGISTPTEVRAALDAGAAGAISGSAVVSLITRHADAAARHAALERFSADMKAATRPPPQPSSLDSGQ
jgi:tryptophan synthase alpha chain